MSDKKSMTDLRRRRLLRGIGATGLAGLAGCVGGDDEAALETPEDNQTEEGGDAEAEEETEEGAPEGGELFFTQVKGPLEFDPIVLNDVPSAQVAGRIFEGLYTYNEDATEMLPRLAVDDPEIERDGERYIVEIKEDATFQNGEPVTAEDAAYSLLAPLEEETANAGEVDMIESAEAIDEKTVQFDLAYPFGAFHVTLGRAIVPRDYREEDLDRFNVEAPIGSGPFEFVDWQEGEFVTIERWDDYWDEPLPNLERVEWNPIEEQTTRVTALQTGESDIIETVPPQLYEEVENMDDAHIDQVLGLGYFYVAFNCLEGPTADLQVREAVDYSFSMDRAVESFVEPAGVRQYSPLPEMIAEDWEFPVEEWAEVPHDRDLDQAEQLFEDAGVDWDYDWRIIVPPDDMREQIGVGIGNGLQEVGFDNVEVQRLDWGAFLEQYNTGNEEDYNIYTLGWSGSPDPEAFTYHLFAQELEGVTNGHYYRNDEVDQQIVEARQLADRDERQELYVDAITTLLEERAHLPAYNLYNSYGVADYVEDFQAHPSSATIPLATRYAAVSTGAQ